MFTSTDETLLYATSYIIEQNINTSPAEYIIEPFMINMYCNVKEQRIFVL